MGPTAEALPETPPLPRAGPLLDGTRHNWRTIFLIAAAVEAFGKLPEVKQWQEARPKTMF